MYFDYEVKNSISLMIRRTITVRQVSLGSKSPTI